MTRARHAALGAVAVLCLAAIVEGCTACGCASTPSPFVTPQGAISKETAISAALALAPPSSDAVTVSGADVGVDPFTDFRTGPLVWLVYLKGTFPVATCAPEIDTRPSPVPSSLPPCMWKGDALVAVLDLISGELIGWEAD